MFHVPEKYRKLTGNYSSNESYGNNGHFEFFIGKINKKVKVLCVVSDGMGWEHVSITLPLCNRCPTWEEMCIIKNIFWDETDCVVQYHPSKDDYISNHNYCLHLWKMVNKEFDKPPKIMVGYNNK
jgi:hypothetical protein